MDWLGLGYGLLGMLGFGLFVLVLWYFDKRHNP